MIRGNRFAYKIVPSLTFVAVSEAIPSGQVVLVILGGCFLIYSFASF